MTHGSSIRKSLRTFVRGRDRDTTLPLLWCVINRVKRTKRILRVVLRQHLRDRRRQRRLAVVNVTNRPYIAVRLGAFKFFFRHFLCCLL